MSDITELSIPDLGDGIDEGVVIAILVEVGDHLVADQAVLEIETNKVTVEVPAPRAGVIAEIMVGVDQTVQPGDPVLRLAIEDAGDAATPPVSGNATEASTAPDLVKTETSAEIGTVLPAATGSSKTIPAGPGARREARELGVELQALVQAGHEGRITRADVRAHVKKRNSGGMAQPKSRQAPRLLPDLTAYGAVRRERLTRIERVTASNLARATTIVPQAWLERRVDITALEAERKQFRSLQAPDDAALTMTAILCCAVATLLQEFPRFNAAFDDVENEIVYREYINVGIAVDTDAGLLVPVVRAADQYDLSGCAEAIARLSAAARNNALQSGELRGAGITISNLGAMGISSIQPIVNWPEAAILGIAAAHRVVEMSGDGTVERLRLPLTLGFDHRLINGADAARFLLRLDEVLTQSVETLAVRT